MATATYCWEAPNSSATCSLSASTNACAGTARDPSIDTDGRGQGQEAVLSKPASVQALPRGPATARQGGARRRLGAPLRRPRATQAVEGGTQGQVAASGLDWPAYGHLPRD